MAYTAAAALASPACAAAAVSRSASGRGRQTRGLGAASVVRPAGSRGGNCTASSAAATAAAAAGVGHHRAPLLSSSGASSSSAASSTPCRRRRVAAVAAISNGAGADEAAAKRVPVFVKLPQDTVSLINTLNYDKALDVGMAALKQVGVEGISVEVWWGIVEGDGPKQYDWSAYRQLMDKVKAAGLRAHVVLGFHSVGCNTGDTCVVSLPPWVLEVAEEDPDVLYTDQLMSRQSEYLSLAVDHKPLFGGRTALQLYQDFMTSFKTEFEAELGTTVTTVSVSMGPEGEMKYPAFPDLPDRFWMFPGIGCFQCYDKYSLEELKRHAVRSGREDWGNGGPHDEGGYNDSPHTTGFFADQGSWNQDYGLFFTRWYAAMLCRHVDAVMRVAVDVFGGSGEQLGSGVVLEAKLPAVHWWHNDPSRAAETTSGYCHGEPAAEGSQEAAALKEILPAGAGAAAGGGAYGPVLGVLAKYGARVRITGVEAGGEEQESLLREQLAAAAGAGCAVAVESGAARFDQDAMDRIVACATSSGGGGEVRAVTFARMEGRLFSPENWQPFMKLVAVMTAGSVEAAGAAAAVVSEEDLGEAWALSAEEDGSSIWNKGRGEGEGEVKGEGGAATRRSEKAYAV